MKTESNRSERKDQNSTIGWNRLPLTWASPFMLWSRWSIGCSSKSIQMTLAVLARGTWLKKQAIEAELVQTTRSISRTLSQACRRNISRATLGCAEGCLSRQKIF
jgi:hypothetical protein